MESRDDLYAEFVKEFTAQLGDRRGGIKQGLSGEFAQRADDLGLNGINLTEEKRAAFLDLVRLRISILRWTALDNIGNIHVLAPEPDRFDDFCQQLPGS